MKVVAYDFGIKRNILRLMASLGINITIVPWDTPAEVVRQMNPDGVFLSNGPGDPAAVESAIEEVRNLLKIFRFSGSASGIRSWLWP